MFILNPGSGIFFVVELCTPTEIAAGAPLPQEPLNAATEKNNQPGCQPDRPEREPVGWLRERLRIGSRGLAGGD